MVPSSISLPTPAQPQQQIIRLSSRSSVLVGAAQQPRIQFTAQSSPTQTPGAQYSIKSSPTQTPGVQYSIQSSPAQTPGAQYSIQSSPSQTSGAQYSIQTFPSQTSGAQYSIQSSPSQTSGAQYSTPASLPQYTAAEGTGSISYSLVPQLTPRNQGKVNTLGARQTLRFSAPSRVGQSMEGSQPLSVGAISTLTPGGQVRLIQSHGSAAPTFNIISGVSSAVGTANIRFTTANSVVLKTVSAAKTDDNPGASQTISLSQYLALNPRSQHSLAQSCSKLPVPEPKPEYPDPVAGISSHLVPRANPDPEPVSTSHSPVSPTVSSRKVFLSSLEKGGQKVIRLDVRSLQSSYQSSNPLSTSGKLKVKSVNCINSYKTNRKIHAMK